MKVVITGGAGFLGQLLAQQVLAAGKVAAGPGSGPELVEELVLADLKPPSDGALAADPRVQVALGDITGDSLRRVIAVAGPLTVFHLASMVSAACEADFDGALAANLEGTRTVLEACRSRASQARLVFASSIVAYGGMAPGDVAADQGRLAPETTYGMTKAVSELLVNDYSRKGFVDGRSARLPTVVVRPGRPNAAASGWVSGIIREPLKGEPVVVPVSEDLSLPVAGYRSVVANLIRLSELPDGALGHDRALNLPSVDVTPRTMTEALRRVAAGPLGSITMRPVPEAERFFAGWAHHASFDRATALGLAGDDGIESVIRQYIEDFGGQVTHG